MELPGFERDPNTGRYFRILPNNRHKSSSDKDEESKELKLKLTVRPSKIPNVLDYFRGRETGSKSFYESDSGSAEYLRLRTTQKVLQRTDNLNELVPNGDMVEVQYIKGLEKSIVGLFRCDPNYRTSSSVNPYSTYAILEQKYTNVAIAQNDDSVVFRKCTYANDLCEGPGNTIATIGNLIRLGNVSFMDRDHDMNYEHPTMNNFLDETPYFCCTTKMPGVTFAIGSEDFIRVVSSHLIEDTYCVLGRIMSIAFDQSRSTMATGLHNGKVFIHDIRSPEGGSPRTEITVFQSSVVELVFIDEFNIVAAGVPDHLLRFDLRKNSIVTHYVGHCQNLKKQSLSVSNNILCANGGDKVVRLWHVSGGTPIHEIRSTVPVKGWLNSENNKTVLYVYEGAERRVYDIM